MVRHISDRIGVIYLGNIVEIADSEDLYTKPAHPYTSTTLIHARTRSNKHRQRTDHPKGEVPSPLNSPSGCKFRTRCKFATEKCAQEVPKMVEIAKGHEVACHLF